MEKKRKRGPYKMSGRPRKPRTNTLYSPRRDEVLRLYAQGVKATDIAKTVRCGRSWVYAILADLDPAERQALTDGAVKKVKDKRK